MSKWGNISLYIKSHYDEYGNSKCHFHKTTIIQHVYMCYDNMCVATVLTTGSDEAGGPEHWSEELVGGAC
jgi:hypothetical protein